jgi:cytochrome P450
VARFAPPRCVQRFGEAGERADLRRARLCRWISPLDLHSVAYLEDPAPTLRWLRERDPVHHSPHGYWLLTRYDDVAAAFRDPRLSSDWTNKRGRRATNDSSDPFTRAQQVVLQSFNMSDPPQHTRLRSLVQQAFSRAAVDQQRERSTPWSTNSSMSVSPQVHSTLSPSWPSRSRSRSLPR